MKTLSALIATVAAALFLAPLATAAPANDNFVRGHVDLESQRSQVGNNLTATKEVGEPAHAGNTADDRSGSRWTAPEDGVFVFDTFRSSFDTLLAVYTGSDVDALTEVASNDDAPGLDRRGASWSFPRPRTWFMRSRLTDSGAREAAWSCVGGKACRTISSTLAGAHRTGRQPRRDERQRHHRARRAESVRAGSLGLVRVDGSGERHGVKFSTRGSRFDTALAVYTGTNVASLTAGGYATTTILSLAVASSFVGFEAVAGTSYRIAVGGFSWDRDPSLSLGRRSSSGRAGTTRSSGRRASKRSAALAATT